MIETSAMKEFILIANIAQIISLPTGFTVTPLTIQQGYLLKRKREVYSEPCQKSKMNVFKQIVNSFYFSKKALSYIFDELFECVWPLCGAGAYRIKTSEIQNH